MSSNDPTPTYTSLPVAIPRRAEPPDPEHRRDPIAADLRNLRPTLQSSPRRCTRAWTTAAVTTRPRWALGSATSPISKAGSQAFAFAFRALAAILDGARACCPAGLAHRQAADDHPTAAAFRLFDTGCAATVPAHSFSYVDLHRGPRTCLAALTGRRPKLVWIETADQSACSKLRRFLGARSVKIAKGARGIPDRGRQNTFFASPYNQQAASAARHRHIVVHSPCDEVPSTATSDVIGPAVAIVRAADPEGSRPTRGCAWAFPAELDRREIRQPPSTAFPFALRGPEGRFGDSASSGTTRTRPPPRWRSG